MMKKKTSKRTFKEKQEKYRQNTALLFFFIFLTITPLLNVNSLLDPSLFSKFTALSIGLLLFFLIFVFVRKFRVQLNISIIREIIFPIYLLFILISGFSIFNAINVSEAYYDLIKNVLFLIFLVFSSVLLINTNNILRSVNKAISVFTIIILIVGIVQFVNIVIHQQYSLRAAYGITGVFAHKNLYSQILFLALPFNIFGIYSLGRWWKMISFINYVLIIFMIIAIMARSVWVATFIALFSSIVFLIIIDRKSLVAEINKNLLKPAIITILTIIVSITVIEAISGKNTFHEKGTIGTHISEIPKIESGNIYNRIVIWTSTLKMFSEYPVLGVGGGNWKIIIPKYGVDKKIIMPEKKRLQRPHNDFLWVLSENGIFGLITWLTILLISIIYLSKIIKASKNREERIFCSLMLFALIGYSTFSFFSFPRERIEHNIYLHFIMAIAIAKHFQLFGNKARTDAYSKKMQLITVPVVLVLLAASYTGLKKISGEMHTKRALKMLDLNNNKLVISEIDQAYSWFSTIDPSSTPLKWFKGLALFKMGKTDEAINNFQSSLKTNPFHSNVLNSLGICCAKKGQFIEAREFFVKSTRLKPFSNEANISLAKIHLMENDEESAIKEFYKADVDNINVHSTYRAFILKYLRKRVDSLKNTFVEKDIKTAITIFTESDIDVFYCYTESYKSNIPFEKQLLNFVYWKLEEYRDHIKPSDMETILNRANGL